MVDASLSISAPRPQAAPARPALPGAPSFAAGLPAAGPQPAQVPAATALAGTATAGDASASTAAGATPPAAAPPAAPAPSAFHVLLSELNPLQYVPVVGTIYRAVTGDTIPEAARFAGGLVVSGLTGGPVGIAMNLGATLIEHLVGIDPEKLGDRLLVELGIGGPAHAAPTALAAAAPPAATAPASSAPAASVPASSAPASSARAWSPAQLAAYGVTGGADGTLHHGNVSGADVLNSLELARIATPALA